MPGRRQGAAKTQRDQLELFSNPFLESYNNKMYYKKIYTKKLIIKKKKIIIILLQKWAKLCHAILDGWMDGWINGWMNQWIDDEWMDVRMDGWTNGYGYGYCSDCMSTLQLIQLLQKQSILQLQQYIHCLILQLLQHMLLLKQVHCLLNENVCIVTRVRIYCEILPEPSGNPLGSALGISLGLRLYFTVYPSSRHNTVTVQNKEPLVCQDMIYDIRPFKCPKLYTNRSLGKQNLRRKVRKFCQNSNCNQMMYLIKYTLRVQFSI